MKLIETEIRPIPRRAANGWMSLGIFEHNSVTYVLELEPGIGTAQPFVHLVEYKRMKRSDDILDGDSEMIKDNEEWDSILKLASEYGILSQKRVEAGLRKAAMLWKSLGTPPFTYTYPCLMYPEIIKEWAAAGRKGRQPPEHVNSSTCALCPKKWREPCLQHLSKIEWDPEYTKDKIGLSLEEKET